METFAKRLKELREEKGNTKASMARLLGVTERAYRRYEDCEAQPNMQAIVKLAKFFGVSTDYLLGIVDV
ncbi:MAG: helix-turn-helix domain-containing protein [Firmicutes bacterium]|nr:helix-turn-helix domain-containing protein [Bacillota bacterium]